MVDSTQLSQVAKISQITGTLTTTLASMLPLKNRISPAMKNRPKDSARITTLTLGRVPKPIAQPSSLVNSKEKIMAHSKKK